MARNASTLRMQVQCVTLWMLSYQQSRIKGKFEQKRRKQQRQRRSAHYSTPHRTLRSNGIEPKRPSKSWPSEPRT